MSGNWWDVQRWDQPPEDLSQAETLPALDAAAPTPMPYQPQPPRPAATRRFGLRAHPLLIVALAVALILAGGGSVLSAVGGSGGRLTGGHTAAHVASATETASATATLEPTLAPTASPTDNATPQQVNLGCSGPLHPPSYVIRSGPTTANAVALTFDDGPSPDWTASILTTLEHTHTPATFFVVGASVRSYPDLVRREVADGDAIAMHTWDHPYMTKLTPSARAWELASTAQAIHNALGPGYCLPYWRPPFGDYNSAVIAQTTAMGLTTVTWSVDPQDWSGPGVQIIVDRVLTAAQPGSIILLHDGYFHRQQTSEALPLIIQGLHDRKLKPVTLPQLFAGGGAAATQ
jgi:peptidoglycan/xylan/chitin deacetylase (PgdA/CDA1 family)